MSEFLDYSLMFESLRAEAEKPWLERVFLAPREFDLMTGPHSILVIGGEGMGKTALELQIKTYAAQKEAPCLLVASWRPQLPTEASSSDQVAEAFLAQTMDSLSFAFLQKIAQKPDVYSSAVPWARDFMLWFIHFYLQGDRMFHLSRLMDQATPEGLETVKFLLSEIPRPLFSQPTPVPTIMSHLTGSVKNMGFEGIWIFVEGLDVLFRTLPDRLEQFLYDFLSTLEFFEDPAFVFKMFVPEELGNQLKAARGVVTRRFKTFDIAWQEDELIHVVEKRIALILNHENFSISKLCTDDKWLIWLKKYAGTSPRGWLNLTQPIVAAYLEKKEIGLSKAEWRDVYRRYPPPLRLDLIAGRVFVGHGEVTLSGIGYKLLVYLYENRHRPCTKSELYYRVHKGLSKEPHNKEDEGWEDQPVWEGTMDTALWRLRQAVEWDTRKGVAPLYVISERGRGQIHLDHVL